jgi:DNA helicase-2/ATP-dependent DNA helicase PcrA
MQDIYKDLNEEQRKAVLHDGGPLLIIAGAGTGKTTVITRRIASLIEKGVAPESILALTFTEKAAAEMEERVDRIVPYGLSNAEISTFHSFGDRVLRENALSLGLVPDYKLLTESESVIFLKEHLFDLPLDLFRPKGDPSKYLSALIKFIGRLKDEDITPEDLLSHVEVLKKNGPPPDGDEEAYRDLVRERAELADTYARYTELMAEKGYLDFGDLVVLTLKLFRLRPNLLKRYRERFSYILADEFQDTNYAQFELLKTLAGGEANLTVVADDDQSIYKFRGAAVSNVLNFLKEYPEASNVTLKKNYRSVQPILDAAYRLICNNNPDRLEVKSGIDKKLEAAVAPEDVGPARFGVKHIHFDSLINEAEFVAEEIEKRVGGDGHGNGARFRDFAVLVRARSDAVPFLRALEARGVPYHFSGNSGLYSREEIVLLVCFLKCITNFTDSVSLAHLAGSIIYGLSAPDLVPCNDLSRRTHTPLLYVMKRVAAGEVPPTIVKVSDEGLSKIKRIVEDIERFSQMAIEEPVGRVLYAFLTDSGYIGRLLEEGSERAEDEVRNISRFFEITRHMEETLSIRKASTLVENLKLLMEAGENPGMAEPDLDDDAVQVLTVHKAKGLEFPTVFMVGLVSERFPRRARKDLLEPPEELIKDILPAGDHHLQEERRLFYVGMTRARETLYLTGSADCGGVRRKKPSRFVVESMDEPHAASPPVLKTGSAGIMETIGRPAAAMGGGGAVQGGAGGRGGAGEIVEAGELSLSFYKIDDYLTCPLKYRFAHVLNIPLLPHHTIIYGKAVHDAISYYFKNRLEGKEITLEEFLEAFKRGWKSEGFLSKEHELARFNSGVESLKRFFEKASGIKPSAVEKDFSIDVAGVLVRGRWDLIVERAGGPFVVDFKTSEITEQKKADKKAKESDQLKLYALAYREAFGRMPAGCELYFVESGLAGAVEPGDKDIEKISEKVATVAEGLKRRDFTARPNYLNCGWCAFNNICPDKEKKAGGLSK